MTYLKLVSCLSLQYQFLLWPALVSALKVMVLHYCKRHTKSVKEHPTILQCHLALDSSTMCIYNFTMSSCNTKITKLYENKKVCMYATSYKTLHLHPLMYLDVGRMGGYIVCMSLQITHKLKCIIIILTQKEKQNIFHNILRGLVSSRAWIFPWRSSWIFTNYYEDIHFARQGIANHTRLLMK